MAEGFPSSLSVQFDLYLTVQQKCLLHINTFCLLFQLQILWIGVQLRSVRGQLASSVSACAAAEGRSRQLSEQLKQREAALANMREDHEKVVSSFKQVNELVNCHDVASTHEAANEGACCAWQCFKCLAYFLLWLTAMSHGLN